MNGPVYYNEFEPRTAAWLRQLIADGHLPAGDVDERSIEDVVPSDLRGYRQCHFFAGIGGWAYALALAGWPSDRSAWTGSCPCQPFSAAGKGAGFDDQRHLWPAWFHLIRECRPDLLFGEQVSSRGGYAWLDVVRSDMEGASYAFGAADICASGFGAPIRRPRLFFVAHPNRQRQPGRSKQNFSQTFRGQPTPRRSHSLRCRAPAYAQAALVVGSDGESRLAESGTDPLAHGVPAGLVRLRGYGNAIVPQVAAEFIAAAVEAWEPLT